MIFKGNEPCYQQPVMQASDQDELARLQVCDRLSGWPCLL